MLSYSAEKITFQQNGISNFEVGQILNSRPSALAPSGYNVQIISKTEKDATFIYQVKTVGLKEVLKSGDFEYLTKEEIVEMRTDPTGEGWKSTNFDFNINGNYNRDPFIVSANAKGLATFAISYKRSGWFGDQDDYLKTYVGVNLYKDTSRPDIQVQVGSRGEVDIFELGLPDYGFLVGAVWLRFENSVTLQAAVESYLSTTVTAGLDLHGTAWVQIEKYANQQARFTNGNDIKVDWQSPSIDELLSGTLSFNFPSLFFESDLYGAGLFKFFGQFDHAVEYRINPSACDYKLKVYRGILVSAGVRGELGKFDYQIDISKDFGLSYSKGVFPGNCNNNSGGGNPSTNVMNFTTTNNVKFKSTDNRYLCSENGGAYAIANRTAAAAYEKFTLEKASDGTYAIKGNNGKYADVDRSNQSRIKFNNSNPNCSDCRFKIVDAGNGFVAIKNTATGKYLSSEGTYNIPVRADRSSIAHWEKWKLIK